jgi:hypothetical protein
MKITLSIQDKNNCGYKIEGDFEVIPRVNEIVIIKKEDHTTTQAIVTNVTFIGKDNGEFHPNLDLKEFD